MVNKRRPGKNSNGVVGQQAEAPVEFATIFKVGKDGGKPMEVDAGNSKILKEVFPSEGIALKSIKQASDLAPIQSIIMGAAANSYLQRGTRFEVLRNLTGGVESTGDALSFKLGGSLKAGHAMLTQQEHQMLVLGQPGSGTEETKLYQADLEAGKVVNDWKFVKHTVDIKQAVLAGLTKGAQIGSGSVFYGMYSGNFSKWDLRTPQGEVETNTPLVATWADGNVTAGAKFTCMATSGDGDIVVGSEDGQIRLYSANCLRKAKVAIPGLNRPVTSVDVTYDGHWVLATTDKFLLVIKTDYLDEKGVHQNAFKLGRGSSRLDVRMLTLKPEDQKKVGSKPFKHAKFSWVTENVAGSSAEKYIVASCGNYTVMWNFRRVKISAATTFDKGHEVPTFDEYVLSANKNEEVVDSSFMHHKYAAATADALIVSTPNTVFTTAGRA